MEKTERKIQTGRRDHSTKRKWQKDRSMPVLDDLKEKRQRLQEKESRLEKEMQRRLERETCGKSRESEDAVRSKGRDRPQERRKDRDSSQRRREDRREARQRRFSRDHDRKKQSRH
ncbi:hypothetical protein RB195_017353 [Necator americanus]|uniref:Uncharacterized protein n=2 Tax=Necator americanus TaxID=51031 RepID=A0ABR1C7D1_NECAM|nr:hypothetical protein NECAME_09370 [Necator americanus]ETN80134.1 hypothetical protein NECAME_09370 [Necator americanus]